ncbi:MAG: class I SAM-dependent methyltransferase [Candidatus Pacebacteria bacterium]|jgi:predicted TPR repeat methyltransferase|nr:class I SAM-dependent methyltransferase [Candidatus Paceibacterota bacterium]
MEDHAKVIAKYNDILAGQYDKATAGEFCWTAPAKLEKHIAPHIKKYMEVLDIGCGTGQTSKIFAERGANVTGVDISEEMLKIAAAKLGYKKLVQRDITQGLAPVFPEERFDIIIAVGVLEFIEDLGASLANARHLLKPGGLLASTYEIYDPGNGCGTKKTALLGDGLENMPELLKFMVYRRTPEEVEETLKNESLAIVEREKFTAYFKTAQKIPVPYELMLLRPDECRRAEAGE